MGKSILGFVIILLVASTCYAEIKDVNVAIEDYSKEYNAHTAQIKKLQQEIETRSIRSIKVLGIIEFLNQQIVKVEEEKE